MRLFVGTQAGLRVLRRVEQDWEQETADPVSGVVDAMAASLNGQATFVGVAHDGVYRLTGEAARSQKCFDADVRALAADPTDPNIVYAGTEPIGLYRSNDGGSVWTQIVGLERLPVEIQDQWWAPGGGFSHVRSIFVSEDGARLYLALEHGGVVRSLNGGATWEDASSGIDYLDVHMVSAIPGPSSRFLAASARGLYVSDDPGRGWTRVQPGTGHDFFHDFVVLPRRTRDVWPRVLAAARGMPDSWEQPDGTFSANAGIICSDDGGLRWRPVTVGLPDPLRAMVSAFALDPHNPDTVYAGLGEVSRADVTGSTGQGWIAVSHDRGESWQDLGLRLPAVRTLLAAQ